jgi:hypothetical protein
VLNVHLAEVLFHALLMARERVDGEPMRRELDVWRGIQLRALHMRKGVLAFTFEQGFAPLT